MIELLFLLLPVAAASGWWAARLSQSRHAVAAAAAGKDPAFFRGLNYLLDEQPDKALDVFLKLAEVDRETVETHLALGSLFRRRGEVDRAIRIHQNLIARPSLDPEQRGYALYELGQDYMRAGLFDRAESLFRELLELKLQPQRALWALIEIYQQEKDWARCLVISRELKVLGVASMGVEMAQYHCELAQEALRAGDGEQANSHLREAQASDPKCARATMLQAELAMERGDTATALDLYLLVMHQDPQYVPEILPHLLACFARVGTPHLSAELRRLYQAQPSAPLLLSLAEAVRAQQGDEAAMALLINYLAGHADLAALARLLDLEVGRSGAAAAPPAVVASLRVVRQLLARQPAYQCEHCGFAARHLHWQCPSCKRWGTIKPLQPDPIVDEAGPVPDGDRI